MQTKHAGTIRGLGITVVVLSAASLALCLLCAVLLGLTGVFFDSSLLDMTTAEMARGGAFDELYGYGYGYGGYGMSGAEIDSILGFLVVVGGILLGWEGRRLRSRQRLPLRSQLPPRLRRQSPVSAIARPARRCGRSWRRRPSL